MAGNFGFRGKMGLSGLDLLVLFGAMPKRTSKKNLKIGLLNFSAAPK